MTDGWNASAEPWIAEMGEEGDFGRRFVLDAPMLARVARRPFRRALDVGCGEGRFCRMLRGRGIHAAGVDPTSRLLARAVELDPRGDYRQVGAEALPFDAASFDLVVSYLTLIDIADVEAAIAEMARVLVPGGVLLIANLTSFATARVGHEDRGREEPFLFAIDNYLEARAEWAQWRGIRIRNWHRPLSLYMRLLLEQGLVLRFFDEPAPSGGDPARALDYRRVPFFLVMEWEKPAA